VSVRAALALGVCAALAAVAIASGIHPAPRVVAPAPVVADDGGALGEVLMHYVPELEPTFAETYRDFLVSLAPDTRVDFVVQHGKRASLDAFLARVAPSIHPRVVEVDVPIGIWSKDRALVLASPSDARIPLLVPPRPRPGEGSRPGDWEIVPALAREMPDRFEVRRIPLAFDAGDFTIAGDRVLVDPNLFARNASRGVRSPADLRARVASLLGREVVLLGDAVGDVPRHHMSMYMAALDGDVALVGDPAAGARILGEGFSPGETSAETGAPLRADAGGETVARFDRAAQALERAGFRVVRIPTIAFDDKTYFAYTNGVFETHGGERIARMPTFDVPALDSAARSVYESLGWRVVPIRARKVYTQHGTIGCLVNVLARH
jgi:hypothetical protein